MGSIIDGRAWIRARIGHLETALAGDDLDEEQRRAVQAELDRLRAEQAEGRWLRRWWWLIGGRRP